MKSRRDRRLVIKIYLLPVKHRALRHWSRSTRAGTPWHVNMALIPRTRLNRDPRGLHMAGSDANKQKHIPQN